MCLAPPQLLQLLLLLLPVPLVLLAPQQLLLLLLAVVLLLHLALERLAPPQLLPPQHLLPLPLPEERPFLPTPPPVGHFGCIACKKRCKTRAGEAAHMFKCHDMVAKFRAYSDTTSCPACLREYHTVDRLHAHLRYATHCNDHLRSIGMNRPIGPGIGSRHNAHLRALHDGLLPFQAGAGRYARASGSSC